MREKRPVEKPATGRRGPIPWAPARPSTRYGSDLRKLAKTLQLREIELYCLLTQCAGPDVRPY